MLGALRVWAYAAPGRTASRLVSPGHHQPQTPQSWRLRGNLRHKGARLERHHHRHKGRATFLRWHLGPAERYDTPSSVSGRLPCFPFKIQYTLSAVPPQPGTRFAGPPVLGPRRFLPTPTKPSSGPVHLKITWHCIQYGLSGCHWCLNEPPPRARGGRPLRAGYKHRFRRTGILRAILLTPLPSNPRRWWKREGNTQAPVSDRPAAPQPVITSPIYKPAHKIHPDAACRLLFLTNFLNHGKRSL